MVKVSVLMPVYKTNLVSLREAIDSILKQTFTDFEFLILDDAPDNKECELLIKTYKDPRIKYFRNAVNMGISRSRNILLEKAEGEYLAIMDHDDISLPKRFEKQVDFLDTHPLYGVVGCHHGFVGRSDISIRPQTNAEIQRMLKFTLGCPLHHPSTMLRKSVLQKNHINYEEVFTPAEDYSLWLRLSKVTKMHNLNEVLFLYRDFDNTTSSTWKIIKNKCIAAQLAINGNLYKFPKDKKRKKFAVRRVVYNKRVHYQVILFGIKMQFSHQCRKAHYNDFFKCLYARQIPLCFKNYFWSFKKFPAVSSFYTNKSDFYTSPRVGIVLQGPIRTDYNFTIETLKLYQNLFLSGNNNVTMIVSTWQDEDPEQISLIKDLGVEVVQSPQCDGGIGNLNKQIVTTRAGLQRAKELGCEYVIKTRTDQRFYTTNILEFLFNILKTFPLDKDVPLRNRLVALSFNSFKFRLYGVSDMFLFGHVDDVIKYWDLPLNIHQPDLRGKTEYENFKENCVETCVCREFVRRIGGKVSDALKDTYWAYYKYFCFIDRETVNLFWPKHTNQESRWDSFTNRALEEVSFRDWLNLFYRKGVNTDWEKEKDFTMPRLD